MFIIGVTGGIGTGKSTVSKIIGAWGFEVLDADRISHEVTSSGGAVIPRIVERFGVEVLHEDGSMDREAMGKLVFRDRKKLDELSMIVHEEVMATMALRIDRARKAGAKAIVLDVPIPVKHGFLDLCDMIIVVQCDDELRLKRLELRGMDRQEAKRRIAMQMTPEEYASVGTFVIENNSDLGTLEEELRQTVGEALSMRGIRWGQTASADLNVEAE